MLGKNLTPEKILLPEVWEKNYYTNKITHTPTPK